jgi:hypothetical protein
MIPSAVVTDTCRKVGSSPCKGSAGAIGRQDAFKQLSNMLAVLTRQARHLRLCKGRQVHGAAHQQEALMKGLISLTSLAFAFGCNTAQAQYTDGTIKIFFTRIFRAEAPWLLRAWPSRISRLL